MERLIAILILATAAAGIPGPAWTANTTAPVATYSASVISVHKRWWGPEIFVKRGVPYSLLAAGGSWGADAYPWVEWWCGTAPAILMDFEGAWYIMFVATSLEDTWCQIVLAEGQNVTWTPDVNIAYIVGKMYAMPKTMLTINGASHPARRPNPGGNRYFVGSSGKATPISGASDAD